jgi:hypothetical protein
MATPAIANEQRGKHDAVLDFFIEKHQNDAALVIDTVVDLLKRRGLLSPDEFTSGLTEAGYLAAWRRHVAGALDRSVEVGAAAAPEPAVTPGDAATVTEDLVELPVTMSSSAQKALDKAKADAAARAGCGRLTRQPPHHARLSHARPDETLLCCCWSQRVGGRDDRDQSRDAVQARRLPECVLRTGEPRRRELHLPPGPAGLP